jgi:hypothetical protein
MLLLLLLPPPPPVVMSIAANLCKASANSGNNTRNRLVSAQSPFHLCFAAFALAKRQPNVTFFHLISDALTNIYMRIFKE